MPAIEVVRPFNKAAHGDIAEPGEVIEVEDLRAEQLKRLGLARDPVALKQAPTPENKMAPTAVTKTVPSAPLKRGPGRPAKVR